MKKGILRNLTKFTEKHLCQSLRPATLLNKRLWHRCFTVNFAKFLRTLFLKEHLRWLPLSIDYGCSDKLLGVQNKLNFRRAFQDYVEFFLLT